MAHFYSRFSFVTGLLFGVFLAVCYRNYLENNINFNIKTSQGSQRHSSYEYWFKNQLLRRKIISWDTIRYSNRTFYLESQYLFNKIKVLCIILVKSTKNFNAVKDTWAKGCNSITPVYLESRNKIMPVKRAKENSSWVLLCNALNNVTLNSFDWILVVKDITFVITENFRYHVAPLDSLKQHYLGHAVKFWGITYNTGDAGYALSRGSVRAFKKNLGKDLCIMNSFWNKEDFYLGKYLARLNITAIDTSDEEGLSTFHPYTWYHVFFPGENYYKTSVFSVNCCSKKSVAFQATEGDKMYTFNYLFYKLQIFYDGNKGNHLRSFSLNDELVWKQFLKERNIHNMNISSKEYYKVWEDLINDPSSFAKNMKKENLFDYD